MLTSFVSNNLASIATVLLSSESREATASNHLYTAEPLDSTGLTSTPRWPPSKAVTSQIAGQQAYGIASPHASKRRWRAQQPPATRR